MRAFGLLIAVESIYVAALAIARDTWSIAVLVLALGSGFAALTWMGPFGKLFPVALGTLGLVAAYAIGSWVVAVVTLGSAILLVVMRRRPLGSGAIRVNPDRIEILESGAAMKNARPFVEAFRSAGFEHAGATLLRLGPTRVINTLLISPDARSYASVTDSVVHVTSLFPGGRGLVTTNHGLNPMPDYLLADPVPGGSPVELIESHAAALETVAQRGHFPIGISAPELPPLSIDAERAVIEWARRRKGHPRRPPSAPLSEREDIDAALAAWHGGDPQEL